MRPWCPLDLAGCPLSTVGTRREAMPVVIPEGHGVSQGPDALFPEPSPEV